jgi:hypothetical protein
MFILPLKSQYNLIEEEKIILLYFILNLKFALLKFSVESFIQFIIRSHLFYYQNEVQ